MGSEQTGLGQLGEDMAQLLIGLALLVLLIAVVVVVITGFLTLAAQHRGW
jgi:hypothetical protein